MSGGARLSLAQFGVAYGVALVAVTVLDGMWLGLIAGELYKREMGSLLADTVRVAPAAVFYLLYPAAIAYLSLLQEPASWIEAVARSTVLGLAAYGAYNLTGLAILRGFTVKIALIDWLWGGFATAIAGGLAWSATWGRR